MSDFSGPTKITPQITAPKAAGRVMPRKEHSSKQTPEQSKQDGRTSEEKPQHAQFRDPAVSISASTAHLRVGQEIKQRVAQVDSAGRPIIETETATFALEPRAGMRAGDQVMLSVVEAAKEVKANLIMLNDKIVDPPIKISLTVISLHGLSQETYTPQTNPSISSQILAAEQTLNPKVNISSLVQEHYTNPTDALSSQELGKSTLASDKAISEITRQANTSHLLNQTNTQAASSADMMTLLQAQQSSRLATMASLSATEGKHPLDHLPKPTHSITFQALDVHQLGKPVELLVRPNPNATMNPDIIIEQVALSKDSLHQLNMPSTPSKHPVYELFTRSGRYIAALPDNLDLRSQQVQVSAFQIAANQQAIGSPQDQATPILAKDLANKYPAKFLATTTQNEMQVSYKNQDIIYPLKPEILAQAAEEKIQITQVTVNKLHMDRAYLSPEGPQIKWRITTTGGDMLVTLPADVARPQIDDLMGLIAQQTAKAVQNLIPNSPVPQISSLTGWPALSEAATILAEGDPVAAADLNARTAMDGTKLPNSMLFLMSVLGKKGHENWLGSTVTAALQKMGQASLLDTLRADIEKIMSQAADTNGEWRGIPIPVDPKDNNLSLFAFLFRQEEKGDGDGSGNKDTDDENDKIQHFIVQVNFSKLGLLQLDGTINNTQFDLNIRSQTPLASSVQSDVKSIFDKALSASAFTGGLSYIVSDKFPVMAEDHINLS